MRCILLLLVLSTLPVAVHDSSAQESVTEPLIFDFEDGLQGWIPLPEAARVDAGTLDGMYAIWGVDNSRIIQSIDLTGPFPNHNLVALILIQSTRTEVIGEGASLWASPSDPRPNPDYRAFDVSGWDGPTNVIVVWNRLVCTPEIRFLASWSTSRAGSTTSRSTLSRFPSQISASVSSSAY